MNEKINIIIICFILCVVCFLSGYFISRAGSTSKADIEKLQDTTRQLDIVKTRFAEYVRSSQNNLEQFERENIKLRADYTKIKSEFDRREEIIRGLNDTCIKLREAIIGLEKVLFGGSD